MSAINPLTIYAARIKALHRVAYHVRKLNDPKDQSTYILDQLIVEFGTGHSPEFIAELKKPGFFFHNILLWGIAQFTSNKMAMTDFEPAQQDLFDDCDDVYCRIKVAGHWKELALGDADAEMVKRIIKVRQNSLKADTLALNRLVLAWDVVRPLLDAHPNWVWRDAVKWLRDHGGLPTI
jgi:hypothetical protein